jgi:hypothetical protein
MAGYRPARSGVLETMADFVERRRREVANLGRDPEAAAHKVYGDVVRGGHDLVLRTQDDVRRFGANLISEREKPQTRSPPATPQVRAASVNGRPPLRPSPPRAKGDWKRNPIVKGAVGGAAARVGQVAGVARGGAHTLEGLAQGADFLRRLSDPMDMLFSAPGQSANAQLWGAVSRGVDHGADYVRQAVADPSTVGRDVKKWTHQKRVELDPSAGPVAPTVREEAWRRLNIGMNQGEAAFDVGSLAVGGPLAKGMSGVGRISNVGNVAKYTAQGFSPEVAAHLAKPYPSKAMGSHYAPRDYKLPKLLGGGPLPKRYSDSAFNVLAPKGISRGDMYELHYKVDPRFHAARLPTGLELRSWHGGRLGLEEYGHLGRLWHGAPEPLKARVGGMGAAAGGAIQDSEAEDAVW